MYIAIATDSYTSSYIICNQIQHYLKLAKEEYAKYFRGMQDYYKAELRTSKEERFLHHIPSGMYCSCQDEDCLDLLVLELLFTCSYTLNQL